MKYVERNGSMIIAAALLLGCALSVQTAHAAETPSVGKTFNFGHYEQDNVVRNGEEEIRWYVLDSQDEKVLVVSYFGLDAMAFNETADGSQWADCSLRKWLNEDFLSLAFTEEEQEAILLTEVDNSAAQANPDWYVGSEEATEDKVFLLSYAEAAGLPSNENRMCPITAYAKNKGAYFIVGFAGSTEIQLGEWWLRSSGANASQAALVSGYGPIERSDLESNAVYVVRPAMWIDWGKAAELVG